MFDSVLVRIDGSQGGRDALALDACPLLVMPRSSASCAHVAVGVVEDPADGC